MSPKKKKRYPWILVVLVVLCCLGSCGLYYAGRPWPSDLREELAPGVVYYRRAQTVPYMMVAHIVSVDMSNPDLRLVITPGDPNTDYPMVAETTSDFLEEYGALVAINGDGFTPWYFNSPFDYYPHPGDPVRPNGLAASEGVQYSHGNGGPTLYISAENRVSFELVDDSVYNAISGDFMLVTGDAPVAGLDDSRLAPRTAVGYDAYDNRLILVVIDGRQPFYSQGVTIADLADLLLYYGATEAMSMDGGGSSTMVIRRASGPQVVNSPIEGYIPGRQRPVANHLGVWLP